MPRTHPHAEASYRVIAFDSGSFGVEVSIPDSYPTVVTMFKTEVDAEAWIAEHQRRVQLEPSPAVGLAARTAVAISVWTRGALTEEVSS